METLFQDLAKHVEVDPKIVLVSMLTATFCSYLFALLYRITYRGKKAYDRDFALSLVLLGALVSTVISLIGHSVTRALGVWGAFSVIRFYRLKVSDGLDITFALASVVIGLACGVGEVVEALMATGVICLLILLFHFLPMGLEGPADTKSGPADDAD
ncbi:MAG: DUF4956 domain-containing protein [Deltaproteobacteria bacterium]|nr:DUF4956 domain-containing protein [Deltaproteobacteria bacterium]